MVDNDIFEINDFTIVTPIEELTAGFENLIQRWNLYDRRPVFLKDADYSFVTKDISVIDFSGNSLKVEYVAPVPKGTAKENEEEELQEYVGCNETDVEPSEVLAPFSAVEDLKRVGFREKDDMDLQFGVKEFILVYSNEQKEPIKTESEANTIMGAIKSALHSSRCEVPVLIRVANSFDSIDNGFCTDGVSSYTFSTALLKRLNKRHTNLAGLTNIFKETIACRNTAIQDEIRVSARFYYPLMVPFHQLHTFSPNAVMMKMMPIGAKGRVPVGVINVKATWQNFREDVLVENEVHSDFNINYASYWTVSILPDFEEDLKGTFANVLNLYKLSKDSKSAKDSAKTVLGKAAGDHAAAGALDKLTGATPSSIRIGNEYHGHNNRDVVGPLPPSLVKAWVAAIFNEEEADKKFDTELKTLFVDDIEEMHQLGADYAEQSKLFAKIFNDKRRQEKLIEKSVKQQFKSAPRNSLLGRLAVAMSQVAMFSSSNNMEEPQLWLQFVAHLREKYENAEDLDPLDASGDINLSYCYFGQQIQLLQACIVAKRRRRNLFENATDITQDEFFDSNSDFVDSLDEIADSNASGRLEPLGRNMLIGNPKERLYVPITQDRSPMTEDMLETHNEYLCSLSEEDRIEAQLEPLRSDMMAFKAANPGCELIDFIRWHSPKDFNDETGSLSERMNVPGNTWIQCWQSAKPIAVINQARLFNETKLAEQVLEQLENCSVKQYRDWLRPIIFTNAFYHLYAIIHDDDIYHEEEFSKTSTIARILRKATVYDVQKDYDIAAKWMENTEILCNRALHLLQLFTHAKKTMHEPYPNQSEVASIITSLVSNSMIHEKLVESEIETPESSGIVLVKPQSPIGRSIASITGLQKLDNNTIWAARKDYVLNWNVARPSSSENKLPQRLYARISDGHQELRFSLGQDANFADIYD